MASLSCTNKSNPSVYSFQFRVTDKTKKAPLLTFPGTFFPLARDFEQRDAQLSIKNLQTRVQNQVFQSLEFLVEDFSQIQFYEARSEREEPLTTYDDLLNLRPSEPDEPIHLNVVIEGLRSNRSQKARALPPPNLMTLTPRGESKTSLSKDSSLERGGNNIFRKRAITTIKEE